MLRLPFCVPPRSSAGWNRRSTCCRRRSATRAIACMQSRGKSGLAVICRSVRQAARAWLEIRVSEPIAWALAARAELADVIARHERAAGDRFGAADAQAHGGAVAAKSTTFRMFRSAWTPARWSAWCIRPCTTRCAPVRAIFISRRNAAGLVVRYRIDGVLVHIATVNGGGCPSRSFRASRSCPNSTLPSAACRRTAGSRSRSTAGRSIFASR